MITSYRKKPVVIQAVQFTSGYDFDGICDFLGYTPVYYGRDSAENGFLIKTLEGDMHVSVGDYIIKGVNGEFYPCKPDIFEKTYEKEKTELQKFFEECDEKK